VFLTIFPLIFLTEGTFFVGKSVSRLIYMTGDRSEEAKGYQSLPFIPSEV